MERDQGQPLDAVASFGSPLARPSQVSIVKNNPMRDERMSLQSPLDMSDCVEYTDLILTESDSRLYYKASIEK